MLRKQQFVASFTEVVVVCRSRRGNSNSLLHLQRLLLISEVVVSSYPRYFYVGTRLVYHWGWSQTVQNCWTFSEHVFSKTSYFIFKISTNKGKENFKFLYLECWKFLGHSTSFLWKENVFSNTVPNQVPLGPRVRRFNHSAIDHAIFCRDLQLQLSVNVCAKFSSMQMSHGSTYFTHIMKSDFQHDSWKQPHNPVLKATFNYNKNFETQPQNSILMTTSIATTTSNENTETPSSRRLLITITTWNHSHEALFSQRLLITTTTSNHHTKHHSDDDRPLTTTATLRVGNS